MRSTPEDDLFEDVVAERKAKAGGKLVRKAPVQKEAKSKAIKEQKQPHTPASIRGRGEDESFENDADMGGSDDYKWSMEETTSDTAKALETFMGKDDLRKQSELSERQIRACALLLEAAGRYKLPRIKNAVHHFLACRVSLNRGSRGEAVSAFTGLVENRRVNAQTAIADQLRREV
jgi:hypothetical protein